MADEARATVGVIGGSGLYQMPDLVDVVEVELDTPFGPPSAPLTIGTLAGARVAFLPRHGRHHEYGPAQVPARANIWALKAIGVERVIAVSAVGSLRETLHPLDLVVPDQIVDRTVGRPRTFFDAGPVVHVGLADPFCPQLRDALIWAASQASDRVHAGGTYLCIEGPQFSTRAESQLYRQWNLDIIGMTAMPEARLAREAELCFAVLAMVTDYDVWHASAEDVTVEQVVANLRRNAETARMVVRNVVARLARPRACACGNALEHAIATAPEGVPAEVRRRLRLLLDRYLPAEPAG
ncbi:MAG: S-methyl-5'-thioadenosine phosphorylase [Sphaerobacter sp.]|nr:S-methyl-5'-thioadenosine phosphorylase [Sphaerobacter sp.]